MKLLLKDDEILVCPSNIKTVVDYAKAYEDIGILVPNSVEIQLVSVKLKRGEDQSTGQQRYLQHLSRDVKPSAPPAESVMALIGKVLSSNLMYVPPKGVKMISGGNV